MNWSRVVAITIAALVVIGGSFICSTSFSQGAKTGDSDYAGSEACKECHPDLYNAFKKSDPHWMNVTNEKLPPSKRGCEACHGPGTKHIEAEGKDFIQSFKEVSAKDRSDACLNCHEKMKNLFQFGRSVHQLSAVGCNDCHQIHWAPSTPPNSLMNKNLLKTKEADLCFSCHPDIKSLFYLPNNHRVIQGFLKCTDCHTPHGTRERANLRKTSLNRHDEVCFKCHPEKRGPWVYEHLNVKVEGCSSCHVPHGSQNRFMLIRREIRLLCAECHGLRHFPNFSCINCHTQIHGSNFSSRFLQ